jgi:mono/diheme cytochrome c family protein
MKSNYFIVLVLFVSMIVVFAACSDHTSPGRIYMPDMTYSRAVETYSELDSNIFTDDTAERGHKIFYNRMPVPLTMTVDGEAPLLLPPPPDSAAYVQSAAIKNPLPPLSSADSLEASRLFNVNCAICHGADGKADGPIAKSGKLGGIKDLTSSDVVKLADGTIFYSISYGKNNMGSYASQLSRKQRWMVIQYVRSIQPKTTTADAASVAKTN